jgi:hypothetical protein
VEWRVACVISWLKTKYNAPGDWVTQSPLSLYSDGSRLIPVTHHRYVSYFFFVFIMTKELITLTLFAERNKVNLASLKSIIKKCPIKPLYHVGTGRSRVDYYDYDELMNVAQTSVKNEIHEKSKLLDIDSLVETMKRQEKQIQQLLHSSSQVHFNLCRLEQQTQSMFSRLIEEVSMLRRIVQSLQPPAPPMPVFAEPRADVPFKDWISMREGMFTRSMNENFKTRNIPDTRPKMLVIGITPAVYSKLVYAFGNSLSLICITSNNEWQVTDYLKDTMVIGIISSVYLDTAEVCDWLLSERHHYVYHESGEFDAFEKQVQELVKTMHQSTCSAFRV